jgi:hypothetical protein
MKRLPYIAFCAAGVFLAAAGCATPPHAPQVPVREPAPATFELADYLPPATATNQMYLRWSPSTADEPATLYERRIDGAGQRDGVFAGVETGAVAQYIATTKGTEPRRYFDWKAVGADGDFGYFLEFDPPLTYLSPTLRTDSPTECRSALRAYDRWGHALRTGTVKRTVRVQGRSDMVVAGVVFRDCLQLTAETAIRMNWGPRVDLTEHLWLARGIGEVKRAERIRALIFPLFFDETYFYDLSTGAAPAASAPSAAPRAPAAWARMAFILDRFLPELRVGGTAVEFAPPPTATAGR